MPAISISAPGKMILCGEHAVVYRQPAIAMPVDQLKTTTRFVAKPLAPAGEILLHAEAISFSGSVQQLDKDHPIRAALRLVQEHFSIAHYPACEIYITSSIPIAAGLGSSASVSVSLLSALAQFIGHPLNTTELNQLAYEVEKLHHGNPSGVDNTVIAYDRPVFFVRGETIDFIEVAEPLHFIIADTGVQASTSEAVARVRELWQHNPQDFEKYFASIGAITRSIRSGLQSGNVAQVGAWMNENHSLLQKMQVSCPELDQLVQVARNSGAFGAKLSGGGMGGNMIALVSPDNAENVCVALKSAGAVSTLETILPATIEEK